MVTLTRQQLNHASESEHPVDVISLVLDVDSAGANKSPVIKGCHCYLIRAARLAKGVSRGLFMGTDQQ